MAKEKEIATTASEETLAQLNNAFPTDESIQRISLPRLGMFSQDVTEGKGKAMTVKNEAGTFYIESQSEETDSEGKRIWEKEEIGTSIQAIIVYQRKQLRHYDSANETFTTSPIFDQADEIVPLFLNKKEIARGTAAELKARPEYQFEKDGKQRISLEDNKILYVLYEGEIYQMTLRGSSMYAYLTYAKSTNPATCITEFCSESQTKGQIDWNQMTFKKVRTLTEDEGQDVLAKQREIIDSVNAEKQYFASISSQAAKVRNENEMNALPDGK